jgi:hypothetical protein
MTLPAQHIHYIASNVKAIAAPPSVYVAGFASARYAMGFFAAKMAGMVSAPEYQQQKQAKSFL